MSKEYEFDEPYIKNFIQNNVHKDFVYVVRGLEDKKYVKIGVSSEPIKRMKSIQRNLPFRIEMLQLFGTSKCMVLETHLHEKFADKRTRGEWFILNDKDLENIKEYVLNLGEL